MVGVVFFFFCNYSFFFNFNFEFFFLKKVQNCVVLVSKQQQLTKA